MHDLLKLVTLLGIPGDYLHLSKVEDGNSIAVIWLCSNSHIIELIAKMHEVTESLQIEGVQQVYVGEQLVLEPMEAIDQISGIQLSRETLEFIGIVYRIRR